MLLSSGAYDAGTHAPSGALAPCECRGQASAPPIPLFSPGTPTLFTSRRVAVTANRSFRFTCREEPNLMKIAFVAEDATALSHATSSESATQETRVAALASALARQQHDVTVHARRDAAGLPGPAQLGAGAPARYVPAAPAEPLADEDVLPHIRTYAESLS